MKDFDGWNARKKAIEASEFRQFVHAREVWWCAIGINIGVEEDGKHGDFERPVLVLRKFSKDAVLVVCLTSRAQSGAPYHVLIEHDRRTFAANISQVRLISTQRLRRRMYKMDSSNFERIRDAVRKTLTDA